MQADRLVAIIKVVTEQDSEADIKEHTPTSFVIASHNRAKLTKMKRGFKTLGYTNGTVVGNTMLRALDPKGRMIFTMVVFTR